MKVFSTGFQSVLQLVSDPKFRNLAYWLFTHLSLIDWQQFASLSLVDHSFVGFWLADRSFAGRSSCGWLQPVQLWCDIMIIKIITSIMILKVITIIMVITIFIIILIIISGLSFICPKVNLPMIATGATLMEAASCQTNQHVRHRRMIQNTKQNTKYETKYKIQNKIQRMQISLFNISRYLIQIDFVFVL